MATACFGVLLNELPLAEDAEDQLLPRQILGDLVQALPKQARPGQEQARGPSESGVSECGELNTGQTYI